MMMRVDVAVLMLVVASTAAWSEFNNAEDILPPSLYSSPGASPSTTSPAEAHSLFKRSFFLSCTGVYDRQLIERLESVCDDCYNVFRDNDVATGCRSNCFFNRMFLQCLEYLVPPSRRNQIREAAQMVGK